MNHPMSARLSTILALTLTSVTPALAWCPDGHQLVADVAAARLGTNARTKVALLLNNQSLSQVAMWADDMRTWQRSRTAANPNPPPPTSLAGDPVALAFFNSRANDHQDLWHFV